MLPSAASKAETAYTGTHDDYVLARFRRVPLSTLSQHSRRLLSPFVPVYAVLEALRGVNVCLATSNSGF